MMRTTLAVLPLLLTASLPAQFSASLAANVPIEVTLLNTSSQPAGPLTSNGAVTETLGAFNLVASASWVVPTASDLSCDVSLDFTTGSLSGSLVPASFRLDTILRVSGPAGAWGTVVVTADRSNSWWPTVDVGNDGTNDTVPAPFYGAIGPGSQRYEWSIPVQLGAGPLQVRIQLPSSQTFSPTFFRTNVRFVPWSTSAADLGSGCAPNHVGWVIGENSAHDYALTVLPGAGSAAATLRARGYGPLQVFAVALQPARLPIGAIGLGNGCDDILTGVAITVAGTPVPFSGDDEWTLDLPALPPGLTLYLQHVSLGAIGSTLYFGATNVALYST